MGSTLSSCLPILACNLALDAHHSPVQKQKQSQRVAEKEKEKAKVQKAQNYLNGDDLTDLPMQKVLAKADHHLFVSDVAKEVI